MSLIYEQTRLVGLSRTASRATKPDVFVKIQKYDPCTRVTLVTSVYIQKDLNCETFVTLFNLVNRSTNPVSETHRDKSAKMI